MRAFGTLLAALLAAAALLASPALAQNPGARWNVAPGQALDLAISPAGDVFAAGQGQLWRWRDDESYWTPIPGAAVRIAAGNTLWAVRSDGVVLRRDSGRWEVLSGAQAVDIALDAQQNPVIARGDGGIARWNPIARSWEPVAGRGAFRIAVHSDGSIWTVAEDGSIAKHDGQRSEPLPGKARDIAISGSTVLIASAEGRLQRWESIGRRWENVEGAPPDAAIVAVSLAGIPWVADSKGLVRTQAPMRLLLGSAAGPDAPQSPEGINYNKRGQRGGQGFGGSSGTRSRAARAASAAAIVVLKPAAQQTDPAPFEFVDTLGTGSRLGIGQDGSVFAIGLDGSFNRWSNTQRRFLNFPGSLVRFSVEAGGNPWGINQAGRIFRHTGTDWKQVRGTASDISVAVNGTVMITSADGVVSRYDPAIDGFVQVPGELYQIALAPDGTPWGLLKDGTVLRCAALPCDRLGINARNISIGPDGSVFIVNFSNELQRFNVNTGLFEFIPVPGYVPVSAAVGPNGRPWVVTNTGKVLSSRFFNRDEGVDLQTASSSVTPTTGSGDAAPVAGPTTPGGTGFTFSKNMQFSTIFVGCGALDDIVTGADGTVLVICDGGSRLDRYNPATRQFDQTIPTPISSVGNADVDLEGRIWLVDFNVNGRIYRQRQKNVNSWEVIQVPIVAGGSPGFSCDIAIAPDGTVYVLDQGGTLYRKTIADTNFTKMIAGSYLKVAVTIANDVWVLTSGTNSSIYQLVGGQLERRTLPSITVRDMGGGPDGSFYAMLQASEDATAFLHKWNAGNRTFDRVNRSGERVDVGTGGRPWVANPFSGGHVFQAR